MFPACLVRQKKYGLKPFENLYTTFENLKKTFAMTKKIDFVLLNQFTDRKFAPSACFIKLIGGYSWRTKQAQAVKKHYINSPKTKNSYQRDLWEF